MDSTLLQLFVHVVDDGTVSAAAPKVFLSQPAATRALQRLESELGVALFRRQGRGLVLTASGRALLPYARRVLDDMAVIRREVRNASVRDFHDVRIGAVDSIGTYLMPSVLADLSSAFDGLGVKFHTARTVELVGRLGDDLDVIIVAYSGSPMDGAIRVGGYELQFYGAKSKFPSLSAVSTEAELADFPIVQIQASSGQPSMLDADAHSFSAVQSLACVKSLVLGEVGVGALLNYMIDENERERLARASIPHDPDCALWVCRSKYFVGDAADLIVDRVSESVSSSLG